MEHSNVNTDNEDRNAVCLVAYNVAHQHSHMSWTIFSFVYGIKVGAVKMCILQITYILEEAANGQLTLNRFYWPLDYYTEHNLSSTSDQSLESSGNFED